MEEIRHRPSRQSVAAYSRPIASSALLLPLFDFVLKSFEQAFTYCSFQMSTNLQYSHAIYTERKLPVEKARREDEQERAVEAGGNGDIIAI